MGSNTSQLLTVLIDVSNLELDDIISLLTV